MTEKQITAQAECAPQPSSRATQHRAIIDTIRRQGFITSWGAIHDVRVHCTKLSTRIGELERKHGHSFVHEPMMNGENRRTGTKYYLPKGMTMDQFLNNA